MSALLRFERYDWRAKKLKRTSLQMLRLLVSWCTNNDGVIVIDNRFRAHSAQWMCIRSFSGAFAELHDLAIVTYEPSSGGRGHHSRVTIRFREFGIQAKDFVPALRGRDEASENQANSSGENRAPVIGARAETILEKKVRCTQPFAPSPSANGAEGLQSRPEILLGFLGDDNNPQRWTPRGLVGAFHERLRTPLFKRGDYFMSREVERAEKILELPIAMIRKAWKRHWGYYEANSRRRKPQSIGTLAWYCANLTEFEAEVARRKRSATYHDRKRKQLTADKERHARIADAEMRARYSLAPPERIPAATVDPTPVFRDTPVPEIPIAVTAEWAEVLAKLKSRIFPQSYDMWILPTRGVSHTGNHWIIAAVHSFAAGYIAEHYGNFIREITGGTFEIIVYNGA